MIRDLSQRYLRFGNARMIRVRGGQNPGVMLPHPFGRVELRPAPAPTPLLLLHQIDPG